MTSGLAPLVYNAPLINPSAQGLWAATQWQESEEPLRWLPSGIEVRPWNFGLDDSFGVWAAGWCAQEEDLGPGDVKESAGRPEGLPAFAAITSWAADECDLTAPSRDEVRTRAAQAHRLREPIAVESEFAVRLLDDAPTPTVVANLVEAVSRLEESFAVTNTVGFIHARPGWAAVAAQANLIIRGSSLPKSPSGHTWVFGGGYVDALGDVLVATSQPFGWRGQVALRTAEDLPHSRFHAIAERSLLIGYEALVGAVEVQ
ncbi:hypothetical protein BH11ACT6_BH11ACT6_53460 [soil metagenome]